MDPHKDIPCQVNVNKINCKSNQTNYQQQSVTWDLEKKKKIHFLLFISQFKEWNDNLW